MPAVNAGDKGDCMEAASLLGMLVLCAYEDIKKKQIRVITVLVFGILGLVFHMLNMEMDIWNILGGMLVGAILFLVSILSREQIGKGDALMLTISGIYLGLFGNLILLWGATFILGLAGIGCRAFNKKVRSLPFAPFLLLVYILILLAEGRGSFVS